MAKPQPVKEPAAAPKAGARKKFLAEGKERVKHQLLARRDIRKKALAVRKSALAQLLNQKSEADRG